ncbi:hypothetical protein M407DRAFT_28073 [Tulasnella calospora MUT 4182]|uniref:Uncharacterized protein n=1 Tax=Tulasnella calospora MUT 4182 TaxID=1051891 RepID=A0A0C3QCS2_9AGAM|nr:hypothetical protein M407DRAFT_28073 [Tulasnella calospora MUT 4182]
MSDLTTTVQTIMLTPENHTLWKDEMEALIVMADAYGIIDGTETQPTGADALRITITDAKAMWERLNNEYETKDASTRFYATQTVMTITFKDNDHRDESYTSFGNRVVDAANKWKLLLGKAPSITPRYDTWVARENTISITNWIAEKQDQSELDVNKVGQKILKRTLFCSLGAGPPNNFNHSCNYPRHTMALKASNPNFV